MLVSKRCVSFFVAIYRLILVGGLLTISIIKLLILGKFYSEQQKELVSIKLSQHLLKLMKISVHIKGEVPESLENTLVVANHISWLDILIISSVIHPKFVAKKEIERWPFVGQLAKFFGTVFVDRENKRSLINVNKQLSVILKNGSCIAVFPEGKTSLGLSVETFKSSLFEPICQAKGYVLPIALQYLDSHNQLTTRPNFAGDITVWRSFWNILTCERLIATLIFEPHLSTQEIPERDKLTIKAQQAIEKHWQI